MFVIVYYLQARFFVRSDFLCLLTSLELSGSSNCLSFCLSFIITCFCWFVAINLKRNNCFYVVCYKVQSLKNTKTQFPQKHQTLCFACLLFIIHLCCSMYAHSQLVSQYPKQRFSLVKVSNTLLSVANFASHYSG